MRKTLSQLRQDFQRAFEDPSTSGLNEGRLFDFLADFLDSMTPAYGVLATPGPLVRSLTTTDQVLPWQVEYIAQLPEFSTDPATGVVTRNQPVCSNRIYVNVDVELAANREVELTLYANDVATPWRTKAIGSGSGRPAIAALEAIHYSAVPVTYQLKALVDQATSVTFSNGVFTVSAVPVREE
jgi:hypothetical protein